MRRYLVIALLACTFSAHALESLRIGKSTVGGGRQRRQGESVARQSIGSRKERKLAQNVVKTSGKRKGKQTKSDDKDKGETWQYRRDGHTTIITMVAGKVAHIDDMSR